jgi:thiosulfate/3-mercaptopyruvate sulfurtransferase
MTMTEKSVEGNLVDPTWLAERLGRDDVVAVGCSLEGFALGHIPGVIFPHHAWLKDEEEPTAVVAPHVFAELLGGLGIDEHTTVVAYDDYDNTYACRLWWVARYYGLRNVKVLDGGWHRWVLEQRPLTEEIATREPTKVDLTPDPSQVAVLDDVVAGLDAGMAVVDLRKTLFWEGRDPNPFGNKRVGRLPGSLNLDTARLIDPESHAFLSREAIVDVLTGAGLRPEDGPVVYCQAGPRSALAVLVWEELGWAPARLYEGSMAEWADRDDAPLVVSG